MKHFFDNIVNNRLYFDEANLQKLLKPNSLDPLTNQELATAVQSGEFYEKLKSPHCAKRTCVIENITTERGKTCCEQSVCLHTVADFENFDPKEIEKSLENGTSSITLNEKWGYSLTMRARREGKGAIDLTNPSGQTNCAHFNNKAGCNLTIDQRPTGGVLLVPMGKIEPRKCTMIINPRHAKTEWNRKDVQQTLRTTFLRHTGTKFEDALRMQEDMQFGHEGRF